MLRDKAQDYENMQRRVFLPTEHVWAPLRGNPRWLAQVVEPSDYPDQKKPNNHCGRVLVRFLEPHPTSIHFQWLRDDELEPFLDFYELRLNAVGSKSGFTYDSLRTCITNCFDAVNREIADANRLGQQLLKEPITMGPAPVPLAESETHDDNLSFTSASTAKSRTISGPAARQSGAKPNGRKTTTPRARAAANTVVSPQRASRLRRACHVARDDSESPEIEIQVSSSPKSSNSSDHLEVESVDLLNTSLASEEMANPVPPRRGGKKAPVTPRKKARSDRGKTRKSRSPRKTAAPVADGVLMLARRGSKRGTSSISPVVGSRQGSWNAGKRKLAAVSQDVMAEPQPNLVPVTEQQPRPVSPAKSADTGPLPSQLAQSHLIEFLNKAESLSDGKRGAYVCVESALTAAARSIAGSVDLESALTQVLAVVERRSSAVIFQVEYLFDNMDGPGPRSPADLQGRLKNCRLKMDEGVFRAVDLPEWLKLDLLLNTSFGTNVPYKFELLVTGWQAQLSCKPVFPDGLSPAIQSDIISCRDSAQFSLLSCPTVLYEISADELHPRTCLTNPLRDVSLIVKGASLLPNRPVGPVNHAKLTIRYCFPWTKYLNLQLRGAVMDWPLPGSNSSPSLWTVIAERMSNSRLLDANGQPTGRRYGTFTLVSEDGVEYGCDHPVVRSVCGQLCRAEQDLLTKRTILPYPAWVLEVFIVVMYDDVWLRFDDFHVLMTLLRFGRRIDCQKIVTMARTNLLEVLLTGSRLFPKELRGDPELAGEEWFRRGLKVNLLLNQRKEVGREEEGPEAMAGPGMDLVGV